MPDSATPKVPSPVFGSVGTSAAVDAAVFVATADRSSCAPCTSTGFGLVAVIGGTNSVGIVTVVGGGASTTENVSGSKSKVRTPSKSVRSMTHRTIRS